MSRELILGMAVSLDGFVSGPNGEIDWMFPTMSDEGREYLIEKYRDIGLIALGRKSYEQMAGFWVNSDLPFSRPMNDTPKAVFTHRESFTPPNFGQLEGTKLKAAESWSNPVVVGQDLIEDVARLKSEEGQSILVIGGHTLASSLIKANLIDEYRLAVHPIALGKGNALFGSLESHLPLKLVEVKQFATGAMVKTYRKMV